MKHFSAYLMRYLAGLILYIFAPVLSAQEPVSFEFEDDFILEEIIVTAQKRTQNIQDVPISVSAFSSQALKNSNITNFSELNRLTAGLSVVDIGNGVGSTIRLRGVGQEAFGLTLQPSVAIIIDGIAQPRLETAFTSFLDIDSIEVLRGPQGTLWGRNAPAGAITVKTKKPDTENWYGSLEHINGTEGTERTVLTANAALVKNVLGLRVTGFRDRSDGFIRYTAQDQTDKSQREGGRAKILFSPTDDLTFTASYERSDIDSVPTRVRNSFGPNINARAARLPATLPVADPFGNIASANVLSDFSSQTENSIFEAEWSVSDHYSLKLISGYQRFDNHLRAEVEASPLDLFNVTFADNRDQTYSHELQWSYNGDDTDYLIGAYHSEVEQRGPTQLNAGVDGIALNNSAAAGFQSGATSNAAFIQALTDLQGGIFNSNEVGELFFLSGSIMVPDINIENEYRTNVSALFGHLTYRLNDMFSIDYGLRFSSETVKSRNTGITTFTVTDPLSPATFSLLPPTDFSDSGTYESLTGTLKLTVALNPDVSLYGGIDLGYKAGGFNGAAGSGVTNNPAKREFDEENTTNIEFGWKAELLGRRLRSNGAIFYQTYRDYQVQLPEATTGTNFISNADVITQGVETELAYRVSDAITIAGTLAYIDANYDDYQDAPCTLTQLAASANPTTCLQDLTDTQLNLNSRWTSNLNLLYQGKAINLGFAKPTWFAYGEMAFRDEFVGDPTGNPETRTASYSTYNAKLGLVDDNWEFELWIKNLTDKEYFVSLEEASFSDGTTGIQGPRRTAGARIKLHLR